LFIHVKNANEASACLTRRVELQHRASAAIDGYLHYTAAFFYSWPPRLPDEVGAGYAAAATQTRHYACLSRELHLQSGFSG
jgi:hypothetical protein